MPSDPKKPFRFFQELKRRNVYRVLAMYAGAAFVIIELTNNVVDPLRLPAWLPTVIILLLIIGFPVTAIVSWIFDLTPEGIIKTGPLEESGKNQETTERARRRLKVSDLIIAVLLLVVCILVYPKIFNQDDFKQARDSKGRVPLAVLPFENMTGDTLLNTWQGGLQDLLITGLSNSEELSVRQYQTTHGVISTRRESFASYTPTLIKNVATQLEINTLINGTYLKAGNEVRISAQLLDAESNEIYKTFQVNGTSESDFFSMADTLTWLIKNYVEIKNLKEKKNSTFINAESYSGSSEAFKYYMYGADALSEMDMAQAIQWLTKALEIDSTYVNAQVFLAHALHMNGTERPAKQLVTKAYKNKDRLAVADKLMLEHLHSYFYETPYEEMVFARQLVDLDEMNPMYWHLMAISHYKVDEFEQAISCWERLFELHDNWGSKWQNPFAYVFLADTYLKTKDYEKAGQLLELGRSLFPQNGYILTYRAIWSIMQEDSELSEKILEDYLSFRNNVTHCPEALISTDYGYIYAQAGQMDVAEEKYRQAIQQDAENLQYQLNLAKFLIDEEINVDEGLEIVNRILEIVPDHYELLHYKGWALYKKEIFAEAAELLETSWEKKPLYNHLHYLHLKQAQQTIGSANPSTADES